jgi:acyl-CoA thioesterase
MTEDELAWQVASAMRAQEGSHAGAGLTLQAARAGYARVALAATPEMLNGHGTLHGGAIFTLADTAFAYACNSRNEAAVASQVSIVFLSPGRAGETLLAEAKEVSREGRSGVYQVTVTGEDGRVVAAFQGLSRFLGRPVLAL